MVKGHQLPLTGAARGLLPPFITMFVPVVLDAASDAKNSNFMTISSAVSRRFGSKDGDLGG